MAREFILFVHICQWIGGETAVPFKTSPGWLTGCHRGKMKNSGDGVQAQTPRRLCRPATVLFDFFFSPGTQASYPLWISHLKKNPQLWTHVFLQILNISVLLVHVLNKSVFQNRRGNRKKREKHWQPQSHNKSMPRVW